MDVRIFALPLPDGLPEQAGTALCPAADSEKRGRYGADPASQGAALSLAAQVLLRYAAAQTTGRAMSQIRVTYLPDGRPSLPGTGLFCSLSHTPGLCVCALSAHPVGIDAERVRHPFPRGAARRVFTAREFADAHCKADPDAACTELWTRRESFVKLTGDGLKSIRLPIPSNVRIQSMVLQEEFSVSIAVFTDWK